MPETSSKFTLNSMMFGCVTPLNFNCVYTTLENYFPLAPLSLVVTVPLCLSAPRSSIRRITGPRTGRHPETIPRIHSVTPQDLSLSVTFVYLAVPPSSSLSPLYHLSACARRRATQSVRVLVSAENDGFMSIYLGAFPPTSTPPCPLPLPLPFPLPRLQSSKFGPRASNPHICFRFLSGVLSVIGSPGNQWVRKRRGSVGVGEEREETGEVACRAPSETTRSTAGEGACK